MANGTRNDSITGQTIDLYFDTTVENELFDVYDFQKVRIYESLEDAQADINHIEEIVSITNISTGKYSYEMSAVATTGTYYDRVFIIFKDGESIWDSADAINPIWVRQEQYGGAAPERTKKFECISTFLIFLMIHRKAIV